MSTYCLTHLSDPDLLRGLATLVAQDRGITATLLAHIVEFEARRLYLPAAYPSTYAYCVHELRLSEDAASKRIQAARVARQFPVLFEALAAGRLHLTGVCLLAPYLSPENAEDLVVVAAHKTKTEIEELLARRFPRSETMALMVSLPAPPPCVDGQLAPGQGEACGTERQGVSPSRYAPAHVGTRSKLAPVAAERFRLELTIGARMRDKLRYAQDLLGHQLPSGEVAQVLERGLDALIVQLERQKLAATARPRHSRPSANPRHIPAAVKRAVWEHVRERLREALPCSQTARVRSHRGGGARRDCQRGGDPAALPGAQPVRGGVRVRSRLHAREA